MKPVRNIVILLVIVILLIGGLYFVFNYEPTEDLSTNPTETQMVTMFERDKNEINKVVITIHGESYTLRKVAEEWVVNGDVLFAIDQSKVATLLYECASIKARELIAENVQDLYPYGLDAPERRVLIEENNGNKTEILIGDASLDGAVHYLMIAGDDKVYTKSASGCSSLAKPLSELYDKSIYALNTEDIGGISINRKGVEPIKLIRSPSEGSAGNVVYEWKMVAPLTAAANEYTIHESLLTNIISQTAIEVIPSPAPGVDYGFNTPQATYSIWNLDETKKYSVLVGNERDGQTYIKLENNQTIYLVSTDKLDFLSINYQQLMDTLVHVEQLTDVTEVRINGKGKAYTMTIKGNGKNGEYAINGKKIEENSFKTAYRAVIGLMMNDYTKNSVSGQSELTIEYFKKDGSITTVECIHYDDRNYVVHVNGKGNLLIRKKQIDAMITQLDKTIQ